MHCFKTQQDAPTLPPRTVHFKMSLWDESPTVAKLAQGSKLPIAHVVITPFTIDTTHDLFHETEWQIGNLSCVATFRLGDFINAVEEKINDIANRFLPTLAPDEKAWSYEIHRNTLMTLETSRLYLLIGHKEFFGQSGFIQSDFLITNARRYWRKRIYEEND